MRFVLFILLFLNFSTAYGITLTEWLDQQRPNHKPRISTCQDTWHVTGDIFAIQWEDHIEYLNLTTKKSKKSRDKLEEKDPYEFVFRGTEDQGSKISGAELFMRHKDDIEYLIDIYSNTPTEDFHMWDIGVFQLVEKVKNEGLLGYVSNLISLIQRSNDEGFLIAPEIRAITNHVINTEITAKNLVLDFLQNFDCSKGRYSRFNEEGRTESIERIICSYDNVSCKKEKK